MGGAIAVEQEEFPVPDELKLPRGDLKEIVRQQQQDPLQGGDPPAEIQAVHDAFRCAVEKFAVFSAFPTEMAEIARRVRPIGAPYADLLIRRCA